MVKASGALFMFVLLPANEIDSGGVVVGVTGADTFDDNSTVDVGNVAGQNVSGVLFALIVEPHLSSTFVPRFSNSISVASFDSSFGGGGLALMFL